MIGDSPKGKAELAAQVWQRLFDFIIQTASQRNHILGSYDLTPNDSRAMFALDTPAGRTMGSLAEEWGCDASYATSVVDRLERRGLAARRSQPGDRRVKLVGLTARGARTKRTVARALYRPPAELLDLELPDLEALWLATAKLRVKPQSAGATRSSTRKARRRRPAPTYEFRASDRRGGQR
jgi:DNA-binding MarR family transcriptional regulator